ncbi:hypothetical protein BDZ88DRAFT_423057 [Geranomyces variabilis]|nr:hypothetical protein BDZ88DRAFT_423057 [Geranomyces variabilis]
MTGAPTMRALVGFFATAPAHCIARCTKFRCDTTTTVRRSFTSNTVERMGVSATLAGRKIKDTVAAVTITHYWTPLQMARSSGSSGHPTG